MCDKVIEVEDALEDVRELVKLRQNEASHDDTAWRREFTTIVQDVVKQDAGWKFV
jgi:hypothetical protein